MAENCNLTVKEADKGRKIVIMDYTEHRELLLNDKDQGFGREKDENRGKFMGSNLVIFCYKEFEKLALCKSISQSETIFIVYSEPIESGHVKINFS